jgi:transcriptional regulator with XRE-family HTH domain
MLQGNKVKTSSERLHEFANRIERSEVFDMEGAKFDISEHIYSMMERQGVSKAKLARRLGKSRAYVTKMLQGNANFTLDSLVRIARALDCALDVSRVLVPIHQEFPMFDWGHARNAKRPRDLGLERKERDYIRLVQPPTLKKEKDNEGLATAA